VPGDSVCIAYLHSTDVAHSWHVSYVASVLYDARPDGPWHLRGGYLAQFGSESSFDMARNKVAKTFLDEKDAEWLLWVDSDMGWEMDALERLIAVADKDDRPIVGGLCFGNRPVGDDGCNGQFFRMYPTAYALDERDDLAGFVPIYDYPVNEVIRVGGTGSAFVLIHRSALERVRAEFGDVWYDRIKHPKNDTAFGEDLSFCLRAVTLDIPIHVHTGVRTNHLKFQYLSDAAFFAHLEAPPATERVDVLVPVLNRPQNAEPFMRSLRASTGLATVSVACNNTIDRDAWLDAGAHRVIVTEDRTTFAQKINDLYASADGAPWVFIVGDDVKFHAGWLDHAQLVGQRSAVVGTNDLGNARVMAGEHATHLLIRRQYIDEVGASWDGPGVVCHEGYRHWFVDDEIVSAAKHRGAWGMALGSIVEHLHPLWGKSDDDETYRLGQRHHAADGKLFRKRLHHEQAVAAA
jgi:hypothetical protein